MDYCVENSLQLKKVIQPSELHQIDIFLSSFFHKWFHIRDIMYLWMLSHINYIATFIFVLLGLMYSVYVVFAVLHSIDGAVSLVVIEIAIILSTIYPFVARTYRRHIRRRLLETLEKIYRCGWKYMQWLV